ncbi:MAG: BON domain-containing protein [Vicinamibacterales bacterium]
MSSDTVNQNDALIKEAVTQQLAWDSEYDADSVGVIVHDGVVTLIGFIDTYAGKLAAERAAKRVRGVRVVANDIQVRLRLDRTDQDIAADISETLRLSSAIPQSIQFVVHGGHVVLTGTAPTLFVSALAGDAVRHIRGVRGIANHVEVLPAATFTDLRRRIAGALHRCADIDAKCLTIVIEGSTVTLDGEVDSWTEVEAAEKAVMHAPGVTEVNNRIRVSPQLVPIPETEAEIC